ncbi:hypothetical protein IMZ48_21640 [Candidatus Bathyarchaeota archaeon]|nr:hypothetical protein [Candidatus Bathyarchaeota archaeon]
MWNNSWSTIQTVPVSHARSTVTAGRNFAYLSPAAQRMNPDRGAAAPIVVWQPESRSRIRYPLSRNDPAEMSCLDKNRIRVKWKTSHVLVDKNRIRPRGISATT